MSSIPYYYRRVMTLTYGSLLVASVLAVAEILLAREIAAVGVEEDSVGFWPVIL